MATDLTGVRIKLDRAEVHLNAMDAAIHEFIEVQLQNASTFSDIDPFNRDWQEVNWRRFPAIDPVLGAVLGDFVHNVRSALDQLMWNLVRANNGKPGTHTQWPVSETEGKWRDDIVDRNTADRGPPPTSGLADDAFQLVYDFQPFRREGTFLFQLLRLSNKDKHRTLHVGRPFVSRQPSRISFQPAGYLTFSKVQKPAKPPPVQDGTPFLRVKVRRIVWPPPENVQVKVAFENIGLHFGFYAEGRYIAAMDHLRPMLDAARDILNAALELPEVVRGT